MRINVTAEDIEKGERDNCYACPVARAALRAGCEDVYVDASFMSAILGHGIDGERRRWTLPAAATAWVLAFDDGRPVEPFSFEVP